MHLCRVCSGATSCDECRVLDSCGWCADSDRCLVGTDAGASDGSCAASGGDDDAANNWWRGSCPAGCSQLLGYCAMSCLLCTLTSRPLAHTHIQHTHTRTGARLAQTLQAVAGVHQEESVNEVMPLHHTMVPARGSTGRQRPTNAGTFQWCNAMPVRLMSRCSPSAPVWPLLSQ